MEAAPADDPWGAERNPQSTSYLHRLVLPEMRARTLAVTTDLTTVAMVLALAVMGFAVASVFSVYATVDGAELSVADDRSGALAVLASSLVGVLACFGARSPSGWGVGVIAGSNAGVMLLHQRIAAGVLADGSHSVQWGVGFVFLSFASFGGLCALLVALSGMRTGQRVTQIPSLLLLPVLALLIGAITVERGDLMSVAYGLGNGARALTAVALFLEGVMWAAAVGSRSRLGAGMLAGSAVAPLVMAVDGAQPLRGLLATAGFGSASSLATVAGVLLLGSALMLACAWPDHHPLRRRLARANELARLS